LVAPRQASLDRTPNVILIDRCYIHGTPAGSVRRGIVLNGARLAVVGSYLSDFHDRGADSQAITGWNGPGPFQIVNNYLEAAGENVIFGGADPAIDPHVPADIELRGWDYLRPSQQTRRIVIRNNLFTDIGGPQGDGNYFSGTLVWMMDGAADVVIDHNTALQSGSPIVASVIVPERKTQSGFVFTNNIARLNQNGVSGDGTLGDP